MTDSRITPQAKKEAHIHYVTAFIGGFLGVYPLLNVVHILGSAQTSNMIECVFALIGGNWRSLGFHLAGVCLYAFAVFLVTFINGHSKLNVKILSLIISVVTGFVMWKLPLNLPAIVYLYPTFFAMAFQWSAFPGAYGYICSTIFSTNNLKQLISSLTEVYCNGKKEFLLKAKFYFATLISFHVGVAISFILWMHIANAGFVFVIVPVIFDMILVLREKGRTE